MIAKTTIIKQQKNLLQSHIRYFLLDNQKMEDLKKTLFTTEKQSIWLKAKYFLKEGKYTIVQGSKDLWHDCKWIMNLKKRKQKEQFTGFELIEKQRIKVDMIKFIPYSIILVVPFAELSLPFILWLYPNATPSFYMFDTAWDKRIEFYEQVQFESHKILIEKLKVVLIDKLNLQPIEFLRG